MKKALVTGCTGQDGSWLCELLSSKGYEVHGFLRRNSIVPANVLPHYGDLTDSAAIHLAIAESRPDEIYHLGAQSHVGASFAEPEYTLRATGLSAQYVLESARRLVPEARIYQAGSSEMFGTTVCEVQRETTTFSPASPYAVAKVFAHHTGCLYRMTGSFVANGILFNHESERRGENFVTRKITRAVGRIKLGLQDKLLLGNLEAKRDWGYAPDYVKAMWLMLQASTPDDFVIATGETHTVREFAEAAFAAVDLDWQKYVVVDDRMKRPAEVPMLRGDSAKAERTLGWSAEVRFSQLVKIMVEHDLKLAQAEAKG